MKTETARHLLSKFTLIISSVILVTALFFSFAEVSLLGETGKITGYNILLNRIDDENGLELPNEDPQYDENGNKKFTPNWPQYFLLAMVYCAFVGCCYGLFVKKPRAAALYMFLSINELILLVYWIFGLRIAQEISAEAFLGLVPVKTLTYIPLILHTLFFILFAILYNTAFKKTSLPLEEQAIAFAQIRTARDKVELCLDEAKVILLAFFVFLAPFASVTNLIAAFFGLLVCGVFMIPLVCWKKHILNKVDCYVEATKSALGQTFRPEEILADHERHCNSIMKRRSLWKYLGILTFLSFFAFVVVLVFAVFPENANLREFLLNGGIIVTAIILCAYPYYLFDEVTTALKDNSVKTAFRSISLRR